MTNPWTCSLFGPPLVRWLWQFQVEISCEDATEYAEHFTMKTQKLPRPGLPLKLPVASCCQLSLLPVAICGVPSWTKWKLRRMFKTFPPSQPRETIYIYCVIIDIVLCVHLSSLYWRIKLVPNLTCLIISWPPALNPCLSLLSISPKGSGDHLGRSWLLDM